MPPPLLLRAHCTDAHIVRVCGYAAGAAERRDRARAVSKGDGGARSSAAREGQRKAAWRDAADASVARIGNDVITARGDGDAKDTVEHRRSARPVRV